MTIAIQAEGLAKSFGATRALDGIDLEVPAGTVLGLLGPNGSGKTTTVRILATLLRPSAGSARVAGFDVLAQSNQVRALIGLTGQYAAVDEVLTGRDNLTLIGRLLELPRTEIKRRADELLERFDLSDAADRPVKTYSGGMRRRLDLAASIVGRPQVLFLDEPTTGLDLRSRLELWDITRGLVADGTTVLLTTQYLEEADHLANRITVIDRGRIIAEGSADELKRQAGGQVLELRPSKAEDLDTVVKIVADLTGNTPTVDQDTRMVSAGIDDSRLLAEAVRRLDDAGVTVDDLALRRPSLNDVFLRLTGHAAEEEAASNGDGPAPRGRRRGARAGRNGS
jgi:oleandomycin transport system ATP-binding protein